MIRTYIIEIFIAHLSALRNWHYEMQEVTQEKYLLVASPLKQYIIVSKHQDSSQCFQSQQYDTPRHKNKTISISSLSS